MWSSRALVHGQRDCGTQRAEVPDSAQHGRRRPGDQRVDHGRHGAQYVLHGSYGRAAQVFYRLDAR
eukprot:6131031-Heterocapsa_arctica.AAC.1